MTKKDLYSLFCKQALREWSNDNIGALWLLIESYLDESKFISQDEKDFKEWLDKSYPNPGGFYYREDLKHAWLSGRKK